MFCYWKENLNDLQTKEISPSHLPVLFIQHVRLTSAWGVRRWNLPSTGKPNAKHKHFGQWILTPVRRPSSNSTAPIQILCFENLSQILIIIPFGYDPMFKQNIFIKGCFIFNSKIMKEAVFCKPALFTFWLEKCLLLSTIKFCIRHHSVTFVRNN